MPATDTAAILNLLCCLNTNMLPHLCTSSEGGTRHKWWLVGASGGTSCQALCLLFSQHISRLSHWAGGTMSALGTWPTCQLFCYLPCCLQARTLFSIGVMAIHTLSNSRLSSMSNFASTHACCSGSAAYVVYCNVCVRRPAETSTTAHHLLSFSSSCQCPENFTTEASEFCMLAKN